MRFDHTNIYFRGRQMQIATAQKILCENYPHLLSSYVVKREVKNETVILHIDWQGVMGTKFFQLIIFSYEKPDERKTADKPSDPVV